MLRTLARLLAALNSESEPRQISLAVGLAMVMGLTPLASLHNVLVLALALVLRTNLSAFLVGWIVFSGVAYAVDPVSHALGLWLLTAPALEPLWTAMYGSTFWRLTHFNDSIVMGSLVLSLALFVPVLWATERAVVQYRARVLAWVRRTRLATFLRATRFWRLYRQFAASGMLP